METKTITSGSKGRQIDLAPTFEEMRVAVPSGAFVFGGQARVLSDSFEADLVSDPSVTTDVTGYLVKEVESGDFVVLLDEVKRDGVEVPFDLKRSTEYERVAKLFRVLLPAGVTSLDDEGVVISVFCSQDRASRVLERPKGTPGPVEKRVTKADLREQAEAEALAEMTRARVSHREEAARRAAEYAEANGDRERAARQAMISELQRARRVEEGDE